MAAAKKIQKKEKLNKKSAKPSSTSKKTTVKSVSQKKTADKKTKSKNLDTSISADKPSNQKFYDQLKLSESYVSLVLGAIVVIGISALFLFYLKESKDATPAPKPEVLNSSVSPVLTKKPAQTYTMGENETLWDVAVKFYGDGFAYPKIIEANKEKIENADFVPPGTVIIIPDAK